jgi:hypothetical protein
MPVWSDGFGASNPMWYDDDLQSSVRKAPTSVWPFARPPCMP